MSPFLIDGDNLLGTWGRERSAAERRQLAFNVARLARRSGKRMLLVFDGDPPPSQAFGAEVRFSGGGRSADDEILALLRRQTDPRGWIVVTNDKSLADQSRWLDARVERCDRFRRRLAGGDESEKPERPDDIEAWLEIFRDDG